MSSISPELTAAIAPGHEADFLQETLGSTLAGPIRRAVDGRAWGHVAQHVAKRGIDVIGALGGLIFLCPLFALIALLIRRESRGPVFFRQTRVGLNGQTFEMLKFRTMVVDAEARLREIEHLNESDGGVLFKVKRDPRVTRVGRILRRTSLDELPQLINILRGEMSLVGPRPLQLRDCKLLAQAEPEGFARRHTVVPGLTGAWQVSDRSETGFTHLIQHDLEYIERWSLALDLRLMVQTVFTIVHGRGLC
jgi:lipopolysaccharide/colanic/teichoic acid biosynthesis glycosyltransferase